MKKINISNLRYIISILSLLVFLTACGGGGGGGSTNPETAFPLDESGWNVPGFTKSANLSGFVIIDRKEYPVTGVYSIRTEEEIYLDDYKVYAIPVRYSFSLELYEIGWEIGYLRIRSKIFHESNNFEPLYMERETDIRIFPSVFDEDFITAIPVETNTIPDVGLLGDAGDITSWVFSNGDYFSGTWHLDTASDGHINRVVDSTLVDGENNIISTMNETWKINVKGEIISLNYNEYDSDDKLAMSLSGNKK